jgi:hypothetical protein
MRRRLGKSVLAADIRTAVSAGVLSVTLLTLVLVGGAILLFSRARRAGRGDAEGHVSRADTQRYLAENWTMVEQTARESGMTDDEIARVRSNVLGIRE